MSTDSQGRVTCDWCQSPYKPAKTIRYYSQYYHNYIPVKLCEDCQRKNDKIQKGEY